MLQETEEDARDTTYVWNFTTFSKGSFLLQEIRQKKKW